MFPISLSNAYGNFSSSHANSQNIGQNIKPESGELFYGKNGENLIPDVSGVSKNGAENSKGANTQESQLAGNKSILGKTDNGECQTCKNRKYQDGSNDPGVSFKTATKLSPEEAAVAVRSHENEHVVRNQAKAEREDRKVVSQSVVLHTAICPECGDPYISGGTTRTVTKADNSASDATSVNSAAEKFQAGTNEEIKGQNLDMTA